ncbi:MAG TPA: LysE family transporter [Polaromonas sp.]|uniref:LysE/ArgO family amino acid transporter n=1 Tax=Polaromonas sp. TaxID=1869339 RepID=UPI002D351E0C|nr:LysE family transporter [Polaromonas sp.]HYW58374.1 LysE family transporter [Polaromonas sp.]
MTSLINSSFFAGMVLSLSLIMAIGPQNAHIIRMGLLRQHLWLTIGVCVATDVVLIAIGVAGVAQLGDTSGSVLHVMTAAGAIVLFLYGAQALRRFLKPARPAAPDSAEKPAGHTTRRQAVGLALALSWLNPHAWLDTAVLIGAASLAYAQPHNAVFGVGAATGSLVWFTGLGAALWCVGHRLDSPAMWKALDLLVALMMWGTAFWLLRSLL